MYADAIPVGLVLDNTTASFDRFFSLRLLIDQQAQGRGYGRGALTQLLALFRAHPQAKEVTISYNRGNEAGRQLFASCGFIGLGPDDAGGIVMWQTLNPQALPWTSLWYLAHSTTPPEV